MPFGAADNYRFNPFDLTKVWPHGDYPLVEVGRMTLARLFSHADAHRARLGVNYRSCRPTPRGPPSTWGEDGTRG